jgi:hypothetical protein
MINMKKKKSNFSSEFLRLHQFFIIKLIQNRHLHFKGH